ncbi:MAG: hypothetical protein ACHRXM_16415 [Isosphaerales bacterium]
MHTSIPRKFTLVDAMVLIAAVGVGFVLIREYLDNPLVRRVLWLVSHDWALSTLWRLGTVLSGMLAPLAVALSLALWILRFRQPRPVLRRVFRQPGMVACSAAVIETSMFVLKALFSEYYLFQKAGMMPQLTHLWIIRLPWNGEVVAVAWMLLWLSGSWRSEPSWIDRAGRVLGVYWVVSGVFFDYVLRY